MSVIVSQASKLCDICQNSASKYCCPRCEVLYCSLACYKSEKHSSCSESFYQQCVQEELASLQTDDESKNKMIDILKRMQDHDLGELNLDDEELQGDDDEEQDSDDNDEQDLEERIKGINLDDADAVWNVMTEDERNEFAALMSQGDVGSFLPQWDPWWAYSKDATSVQPLENVLEQTALKKCPAVHEVPEFSTLTKVQPSPAIRFNITNVLASYAFVMRYFNGEYEPIEWTSYFLNVCSNLDSNNNFEDAGTAVESVKQKCLQSQLIETDEASLNVMKLDTFSLLQGPSEENKLLYCQAALSDIRRLFNEARTATKETKDKQPTEPTSEEQKATGNKTFSKKFLDNKGDYLPKLDAAKLKKCVKKVEFYLSYVNSFGLDFE